LGFRVVLRIGLALLVVGASATAQAFDFSRPSESGCLERNSKAWCLMATKGFGTYLKDVPAPPAEPQAASDLDTGRAVGQGVTAGGVALHARAAAGLDPTMTRAMGGAFIVLDLLTHSDPTLPLRGFLMLAWMPKGFPQDGDTPKLAMEKLLVQAMVTATGSTGAEAVEFKWEALFKTDIVHYYKLAGAGKHQGNTFISKLWQYNAGLSWSDGTAPEYLGGADSYTFDLDIVPRFATVEKKPKFTFNTTVLRDFSTALPAWAVIYVPPMGGKDPYLLQQGQVLAFEQPATVTTSGPTPLTNR
jgi:hypothetical protein